MKKTLPKFLTCLLALMSTSSLVSAQISATPEEARAIAKEAYIYGNPMVDHYRIQYDYFVNKESLDYKTTWNEIINLARVFTSDDKAVQTPNSDTPYSFIGMDLRTELLVITVPTIDKNRYFSLQFMDSYTHNFDFVGSRTTGNDGGVILVAGPDWKGETPEGVTKVIRSETHFAYVMFRTQLFNPADIDKVKEIQTGYKVQTLSDYLGQPAPTPAPEVEWIKPLSVADQKASPEVFNQLSFVLQFCPTVESEEELMERFSKIGIGAGEKIDVAALTPEMKKALTDGIADAWKELDHLMKTDVASGKVTSGDVFGTREYLNGNYLYRFAGAVLGIYGLSKDEAIYPIYRADDDGEPLDASKHRYTLSFESGKFPPVNAFWSVTMYKLPESLLSANPLNRYLLNSPMLPDLKKDTDGGVTIYIQHESPGEDKESNWLPAPEGPFWMAMRLYWPKAEALDGTWETPVLTKVE